MSAFGGKADMAEDWPTSENFRLPFQRSMPGCDASDARSHPISHIAAMVPQCCLRSRWRGLIFRRGLDIPRLGSESKPPTRRAVPLARRAHWVSMRSLLVGIAILIAGATATRAQTLPFYNIDELAKKCVETAAEAATKYSRLGDLSSFLADEAVCKALSNMDRQSLAELAKNWNLLASSIRLQCIANRSVDSYFGLKQCIEQVAKRGREIASRKQ